MWSLVCAESIRHRAWEGEDEAVVYDVRSGDTHLVAAPGLELLQRLAQSPCTREVLVHELRGLFVDDDPHTVVQCVDATLSRLQAVGLVSEAQV